MVSGILGFISKKNEIPEDFGNLGVLKIGVPYFAGDYMFGLDLGFFWQFLELRDTQKGHLGLK